MTCPQRYPLGPARTTAVLSRGSSTLKSDEAMMAAETKVNFLAVT